MYFQTYCKSGNLPTLEHPNIDFNLNNEAQVRTPIATTPCHCTRTGKYLLASMHKLHHVQVTRHKHPKHLSTYRWLRKDRHWQSYHQTVNLFTSLQDPSFLNTCLYRWLRRDRQSRSYHQTVNQFGEGLCRSQSLCSLTLCSL